MSSLWDALPSEERRSDLRVESVPRELLPSLLRVPALNIGDMAPGATPSNEALRICSDIHERRASVEQLRGWANDPILEASFRAGIRFELATALCHDSVADSRSIEEAISEWRLVIRSYPRASAARRWALACLELAQVYSVRQEASRSANLREAMRLLDSSLEVLTVERHAEDFALAQSRRASLLLDMGSDAHLVDQSLAAYEAALTVYTQLSYPNEWGRSLSNMATAYLTRGGYSGHEDIHKSISLMEQALVVRTRQARTSEWALTQMNLGIALSRLPESEGSGHYRRAIETLRGAYEAFGELGDHHWQMAAAHNLGITLRPSQEPATASEAVDRLEQSLPWLSATGQSQQASDAVDSLSEAYVAWLHHELDPATSDEICRRALAAFKDHSETKSGCRVNCEVGFWNLRNAHSRPDRLERSRVAFERVLETTRSQQYAEVRATTLANLATVLLIQAHGQKNLDYVRAGACIEEALRILRSLPATPKREEAIGLLFMNKTRSGFGT